MAANRRYVFNADFRSLTRVVRSIKRTACGGRPLRPRPVRPRPQIRPSGRVCRKPLDLAFLVDGSGSIEAYGRGNFRRCLNFVKRVVASFHISPRHTRVGVVLFSSRAWLVLNFRRSRNKHSVLYAISRMRYPRGGTRIGRALRFARYKLFNRRTNRRKVLIVMTDGISQDKVDRPSRNLRSAGVRILALGIGKRFRRAQLNQMAANRRYVFNADFRSLTRVVRSIKRTACGAKGLRRRRGGRRVRRRRRGRKMRHVRRIRRKKWRRRRRRGRRIRTKKRKFLRRKRRRRRRRKKIGKKRSEVTRKPNSNEDNGETSDNGDQLQWNQRSKIAKTKTAAPTTNLSASYLWHFKSSLNNSVAVDEVRGRKIHLEGGALVANTTERGLVADTNGGWMSLKETNDTCFSDPGQCADKGMTVMSWLKLNKTSLSQTTSSYIMSSGGQSTKARGFAVLYLPKSYIVILSTKNKQWKLDTPVLPSGWFNLAFTWRENGQLKLYVNGTHVASGNPALVSRPQDSFTTFVIGRPNNSEKPLYRFPLNINDLALWERELSENEIKSAMHWQPNKPSDSREKDQKN